MVLRLTLVRGTPPDGGFSLSEGVKLTEGGSSRVATLQAVALCGWWLSTEGHYSPGDPGSLSHGLKDSRRTHYPPPSQASQAFATPPKAITDWQGVHLPQPKHSLTSNKQSLTGTAGSDRTPATGTR